MNWWEENLNRRTRVIPILLLDQKGFYKTTKFKRPVYLGDGLNILKIFNEKVVDEFVILSYRDSLKNREIDFDFLEILCSEARYPVTYGGNVNSLKDMEKIYALGVEKIVLNSVLHYNPEFLEQAVLNFGSSSVVACIELKTNFLGQTKISSYSGNKYSKRTLSQHIDLINYSQVGETIIVDSNRDGTMEGYNLNFLKDIVEKLNMPVIINGGAGKFSHLLDAQNEFQIEGFGLGSMVVYSGNNKGILINVPSEDKLKMLN